jgi:hypothetical protein
VGGTRQHHFDGTNFKPHKLLENAPSPTSQVHAVLGGVLNDQNLCSLNKIILPETVIR